METSVAAPALLVQVTAYAWTPKQAARIQAQLERMFTGLEIAIVPNEIPAPAEKTPEETAITFPAAADDIPKEPVAVEAPPPPAPVQCGALLLLVGDRLRDENGGAVVEVTSIDEAAKSFVVKTTDLDAAEKSWPVPFDAAAYYELVSEKRANE